MQESVFFTQTLLPLNLTFRMKTLQHCSQAVHRLTSRGSVAAIVVYLYKACWKLTFHCPLGFKFLNMGWENFLGLVTGCSANASLFRWWKALLNGSKSYRIAIPVLAATIYTAKQPKKLKMDWKSLKRNTIVSVLAKAYRHCIMNTSSFQYKTMVTDSAVWQPDSSVH